MFDLFLAELLVLLMILVVSLRIFFTKNARIDSTVILAPISFGFSLLIFYIWGIDPVILVLCFLSLLTFFINLRSLLRLSARLVVDYYNLRFVIPSILIALAATGLFALLVIFRPVRYRPQDFGVTKTKVSLTGNGTSGYQERKTLFEKSSVTGTLYEYAPKLDETTASDETPVILFVPKSTATVAHYEPYFLMLAQKGYRVLSADLYAPFPALYGNALDKRFFRRAYSMILSVFYKEEFAKFSETDEQINLLGYKELSRLALKRYGDKARLFYAVYGIDLDALNELTTTFAENAFGFFALNRVAEYQGGDYGFLEQTDPLTAYFFGQKRDASFFIPRYVAGKTTEAIEQAQKLAAPIEIIKGETDDAN